MQHRISAGVLVESDGRLLMVRHLKRGAYDFWVAPGGGVVGDESLEHAARREAREETGLEVVPLRIAYIEELLQPTCRHCKFWFHARLAGGELSTAAHAARDEHIVDAAWLSRRDFEGKSVFPPIVADRYWRDRQDGPAAPVHLPLRRMEFW